MLLLSACASPGEIEPQATPVDPGQARPATVATETALAKTTSTLTSPETQPEPSRPPATIPSGLQRVPTSEPVVPVTGEVPSVLLDAIITDLKAREDISAQAITIIRAESTLWPDGALGCPEPGETYTQAPVEGYWVVLESEEQEYDYRATDGGHFFLCEPGINAGYPAGQAPTRQLSPG